MARLSATVQQDDRRPATLSGAFDGQLHAMARCHRAYMAHDVALPSEG